MARILIVHPTLMAKGGGEAVCMNVLEALQDEHDITVLTAQEPDFEELNEYFSTSVANVNVHLLDGLASLSYHLPTGQFNRLRVSHLNRHIVKNRLSSHYDLLFSTFNDFRFRADSIQYIHHPNFERDLFPGMGGGYPALVYSVYDHICDTVSPSQVSRQEDVNTIYLANSDWTASQVEESLGKRPRTVYPPVTTPNLDSEPWDERLTEFVSIGRITSEKNILRNIDILAELNNRGHDVDYHVVGPAIDKFVLFGESYQDQVEARAAEYDFVHLEGEVSRNRLVELVTTRKYGLHGMNHEHFGIGVAELVAGGTIPFVPRGGGQTEVVGNCEAILYDSVTDAVEKMDTLLSDEQRQREVRAHLPDIEKRFGRERFQQEIRRITNDGLS
jgi:glycosyltransferase involved in cell wall biosynthesis